jgi:hypothetical protein
MVEEYEFELLKMIICKPHWELNLDWFKTYAISINLTALEIERVISNLTVIIDKQIEMWGNDNLRVSLLQKAESTLRNKLMTFIEG